MVGIKDQKKLTGGKGFKNVKGNFFTYPGEIIKTIAIFIFIWPEPGLRELLILAAINWPVAIISIWGVSKILGTKQYENIE